MSPPNQPPSHQTIIVNAAPASQALPALVNAFCIPGLGQLLQGRLLAAIFWWVLWGLSALSLIVGVGIVLLPLCWLGCILDAACYRPGTSGGSTISSVIMGGAAAGALVLIAVGGAITLAGLGSAAVKNSAQVSADAAQGRPPTESQSEPAQRQTSESDVVEPRREEAKAAVDEPMPAIVLPSSTPASDLPAPPPPTRPTRTWSSADGKFSVEAEFLSRSFDKVKLRKADGTEISVPLDRLSDEDRQWLRDYEKGR